ncbi:helix-turn-helix domain-containing protein [Nocardia sp. CS682]|uniref:AraC family transcriptional regulator n=1 Tax=Nocardia sp. CS682 TaxID=1047172 RepID=UPI0010756EBD|nr:helix-turn-helix domain-containing protein [Nocardia sp. CS682]QBS46050.1 AraC family transcriptional regulator [Nocardia sp. CS682]
MLRTAPVVTTDLVEATVPVPESLRPWFTELGRIPMVHDLPELFTHLPQTATTLVLRTEEFGPREMLVIGPQTKAFYTEQIKPAGCVRLRLAPGAARPLLGVPAAALTNRVVRLADLPGAAADLADRLAELAPDEIVSFLEEALPQRISENASLRTQRDVLRAAVVALSTDPTGRSVQALADELAVSERQLRNLFTAGIGLSPKHFARIDRVRRVLAQAGNARWRSTSTPWARTPLAQLAADNGYFDQSHMTADFRTLMGVPPTSFLRGALPTPTPCRPLDRI